MEQLEPLSSGNKEFDGLIVDDDMQLYDMLQVLVTRVPNDNLNEDFLSIDYLGEARRFLTSGVLRAFDESSQAYRNFVDFLLSKRSEEFLRLGFWTILSRRFPECFVSDVIKTIQDSLQQQFSHNHLKMMQRNELGGCE